MKYTPEMQFMKSKQAVVANGADDDAILAKILIPENEGGVQVS